MSSANLDKGVAVTIHIPQNVKDDFAAAAASEEYSLRVFLSRLLRKVHAQKFGDTTGILTPNTDKTISIVKN